MFIDTYPVNHLNSFLGNKVTAEFLNEEQLGTQEALPVDKWQTV